MVTVPWTEGGNVDREDWTTLTDGECRWLRDRIMDEVEKDDVEPASDFARCINRAFGLPEFDGW